MICPVCCDPISSKRKKQIKHLYTHSSEELVLTVLHLDQELRIYRRGASERQEQPAIVPLDNSDPPVEQLSMVVETGEFPDPGEQPATQALDSPNGECTCFECRQQRGALADVEPPDDWSGVKIGSLADPNGVFSLVEEDSEEDSDPDMRAAGMVQCEHCGLWVWPNDMPYHLAVACVEVGAQLTAPPVEQPPDYAEVQYIRIAVDGPEWSVLNALTRYSHYAQTHYIPDGPSFLDAIYYRANGGKEYYLPADGIEVEMLNALAWYVVRSTGK